MEWRLSDNRMDAFPHTHTTLTQTHASHLVLKKKEVLIYYLKKNILKINKLKNF
jgi:hypothetical protein